MFKKKKKFVGYDERLKILEFAFASMQDDYHENNIPTDLYDFFFEVLKALPQSYITENNVLGLFHSALKDVLGKEYRPFDIPNADVIPKIPHDTKILFKEI